MPKSKTERELWIELIRALRRCREMAEQIEARSVPPQRPKLRVVKGGDDG